VAVMTETVAPFGAEKQRRHVAVQTVMAASDATVPPMAEAARWLEWQGRGAAARSAAVALVAGATAATAGAFIHAAFTPGAARMHLPIAVQSSTDHFHGSRRGRRRPWAPDF
jgi:hypothetical protein